MLIGVSFIFLTLTFPVVLIYLLANHFKYKFEQIEITQSVSSYEIFIICQKIAGLLMYMNHSLKFIVYISISSKYRNMLKRLLSLKKSND